MGTDRTGGVRMSDRFTSEQHEVMERWLDDNGYGTYEAWAADSDYTAHGEAESDTLHWMDEHGNYVDIRVCLWHAIEAEGGDDACDTCGGSGRWESTLEDSPTTLVDLGPCPECGGVESAKSVLRYLKSWIRGSMGWADDADVAALVGACRLIEAAYLKE